MKKISALTILILMIFAFLPLVASEELPNYYDKYVNDFAKIFSDNETLVLRTLLYETDLNTTAEVVVATIKECVQEPNAYAFALASNWQIGKADKDNGLIILYCQKENKISVQTGYGLEGILPDSKLGRMLDDYYVPLRDVNRTREGIIWFTQEIVKVIEENRAEVLSGQAGADANKSVDYVAVIIWILLVYIIFSKIIGAIYRRGNKKRKMPWFMPILVPFPSSNHSRNSSSGFGGGFGGGGFGGGGFGGGGASR